MGSSKLVPNGPFPECFIIVKSAGDNNRPDTPYNEFYADGRTAVFHQTGDVHLFVATNREYYNLEEAQEVADKLAKETPGNRYYVTKILTGVRAQPAKLVRRKY